MLKITTISGLAGIVIGQLFPLCARADTQRFVADGEMTKAAGLGAYFLPDSTDLRNSASARGLYAATIEKTLAGAGRKPAFVIIHAVRWSVPDKDKGDRQTAAASWYVCDITRKTMERPSYTEWSYDDLASRDRLFGARTIAFLYVHL